jgi:hypothetical protein
VSDYKKQAQLKREKLRSEYWPDDPAWMKQKESGFFQAPRYLPLLLSLLGSKQISGKKDPSRVYLELYSRHRDGGVIEMEDERQHAFAAGYEGSRAARTWQERMKILEHHGFIRVKAVGNQPYKYVLLVHPMAVIRRLHADGKTEQHWWDTYRARLTDLKEDDSKYAAEPEPRPKPHKLKVASSA